MLSYIIHNKQFEFPYDHLSIPIDTLLFNKYIGRYRIENIPFTSVRKSVQVPATILISNKNGRLMFSFEGEADIELNSESATNFFATTIPDVQFEFELNSRGDIKKAFYIVHGMKNEIMKLNKHAL